MSVSPVVKKDLLIGGGVLLGAIIIGRFVHHTPAGTVIPSPTGAMRLQGGTLSGQTGGIAPSLGDYPTTPPAGVVSNPPVNSNPGLLPHRPIDDLRGKGSPTTLPIVDDPYHPIEDPHGPTTPTNPLPGTQPTASCYTLSNGVTVCPPPPSMLPGVR